ncbi:hypothetical protein [Streptomyces daghestanicus]|uniref:Uncharacterized protein n=1 Tax=Streptomyces daghestanicus TaxID=66885 RepID=A0ABQ3PYU9_9ACTN|nr:hypothetical protein [Streptomyces daghestanicus]GGU47001.1 hypothetical protein GCM10010259_42540 [Streptomyces daghestanicus]GHI30203.1 hypothetical protein Sdagh_19330 [Streptomyces daghestanicus]
MTLPTPVTIQGYLPDPNPLLAGKSGSIQVSCRRGDYDAKTGAILDLDFPFGAGPGALTTKDGARAIRPKATNARRWTFDQVAFDDKNGRAAIRARRASTWDTSVPVERITLEDIAVGLPPHDTDLAVYQVSKGGERQQRLASHTLPKSTAELSFTDLEPDDPVVSRGQTTRLTWNLTRTSTDPVLTVSYAGTGRTPYSTTGPKKYQQNSWTTPRLDDQAVVFVVTATIGEVGLSQWTQVHVRRGAASTGPLTVTGTVRLLGSPAERLFDDLLLSVPQAGLRKAEGVIDGSRHVIAPEQFDAFFENWYAQTHTDGLLTVHCAGASPERGHEGVLKLKVGVPQGDATEDGPAGSREWPVTSRTALTLPLPRGTALTLTPPHYTHSHLLSMHWTAFGTTASPRKGTA